MRGQRASNHGCSTVPGARRALVLPVVLVVISLLALTLASFIFFVQSERSGAAAYTLDQQSRLTAESGLEELVSILRLGKHDAKAWFDNPQRLRHALVWAELYDRQSDPVREAGSRKELLEPGVRPSPAWRYSVVAPNWDGPRDTVRYGITPESAFLNINLATEEQISRLLTPLLLDLAVENPQDLINALLDWRDEDSDARQNSAENEYYNALEPPYNAKNAALDTIEELLLVKGFSAAVLYGEDTNRNGILDLNEDDGDASFPPYDNGDGVLNPGIAPFLTVLGREWDQALDNKPRINLNNDAAIIAAQIADQFKEGELSDATIGFITQLKQQDFDFSQLRSPADLYTAEERLGGPGDAAPRQRTPRNPPGQQNPQPQEDEDAPRPRGRQPRRFDDGPNEQSGPPGQPNLDDLRQQEGEPGDEGAPGQVVEDGDGPAPYQVPQQLMSSPVTLEELPYLMDRFSVRPADQASAEMTGLIHLNAAPQRVLELISGMTGEAAAAIVARRRELEADVLRTTAWPITTGTVDAPTYKAVIGALTTKSQQFRVEIVSYADHLKVMRRYEWSIEMIGPLPQVRYWRDLTSLGPAWPVDDDTLVVTQP